MVEFLDQILPGMDGEVRKEAQQDLQEAGHRVQALDQGHRRDGQGQEGDADDRARRGRRRPRRSRPMACWSRSAAGPTPTASALDKAGLELNQRGQIETDHDFRTKVDGVWAIGDVIPGPMLAHKAEDEGIAVAENIAGQTGIVNHEVIPSVVYTWPEIAGVGLTEEAAKETRRGQGRQVPDDGQQPRQDQPRARRLRQGDRRRQDRPRARRVDASPRVAGTMIAQAAQAMEFGATSEDIAYTCHAHPTHTEALKEAAMAVTGKPIHI